MPRLGMDVEAALGIAGRIQYDALGELTRVQAGLKGLIAQLESVWQGEDAQAFQAQWPGHAQSLTLVQGALQDLHHALTAAIGDQQAASGGN